MKQIGAGANHPRAVISMQTESTQQSNLPLARAYWPPQGTKNYGGFIGYGNLLKSLQKCIVPDPDSDIYFTLCDPAKYRARSDKRVNMCFTMWEHEEVPEKYVANLRQADAVVTCSQFCKRVFEDILDCPVYFVPLAIDDQLFSYKKRSRPRGNKPFRWLWLNAADPRKGYDHLARLWEKFYFNDPRVELYMKTTSNVKEQIVTHGNVTFDSRILPPDEIAALYHSAHGFIYLSWGEGFGYTLAEAMSTGLPCVATERSGYVDFFNSSNGYPVSYKLHRVARELFGSDGEDYSRSNAPDGKYSIAIGDSRQCVNSMNTIMSKYGRAMKKGLHASQGLRKHYNMQTMARAISDIFQLYN